MTESNKRMKKKSIKYRVIQIGILLVLLTAVAIYVSAKDNRLANRLASGYEVHGVDVSHYQGKIDWQVLAGQGIDFAFIKATEGSGHIDRKFYENWEAADATELKAGAYHFFSFDSPAETQAQLYIETVGDLSGRLMPVVDIEFYGDKVSNPPEEEEIVKELKTMLELLEAEYGVKPMVYTTYTFYYKYLNGEIDGYPLWIRNVYFSPNTDMRGEWTFWQYTDQAVLNGYSGAEEHIDLNVFYGSLDELDEYVIWE